MHVKGKTYIDPFRTVSLEELRKLSAATIILNPEDTPQNKIKKICKKGSLYLLGGCIGLGPNILIAIAGLSAYSFKAIQNRTVHLIYKRKLYQMRYICDDAPEKKRFYIIQSRIQIEFDKLKGDVKNCFLVAVPIVGPQIACKALIQKFDKTVFLDPTLINFNSSLVVEKIIKKMTFPLCHRFPKWAYATPKERRSNTPSQELVEAKRVKLLVSGSQKIILATEDHRNLKAIWIAGKKPKGPTAILFHGPHMVMEDMKDWMKFYHKRGINVLLLSIGGYGKYRGEKKFKPTEQSIIFDANAAFEFLQKDKEIFNDNILVHGISTIGGKMASHLGKTQPNLHLILDQSPTSLQDAAANYLKKFTHDKEKKVKQLIKKQFHFKNENLNGFNCQEDLKNTMAASFLAISSKRDLLMGWGNPENVEDGVINFSQILANTYREAEHQTSSQILIEFDGSHGECFAKSPKAVKKVDAHLKSIKFLS